MRTASMMSPEEVAQRRSEELPPRSPDWVKDGIGMTPEGCLVLRIGSMTRTATVERWAEMHANQWQLENELLSLKRRLAGVEPHRFLKDAIAELETRATEAGKLRGEGMAGKVMWGQAQAYRDAIALLKSFTE